MKKTLFLLFSISFLVCQNFNTDSVQGIRFTQWSYRTHSFENFRDFNESSLIDIGLQCEFKTSFTLKNKNDELLSLVIPNYIGDISVYLNDSLVYNNSEITYRKRSENIICHPKLFKSNNEIRVIVTNLNKELISGVFSFQLGLTNRLQYSSSDFEKTNMIKVGLFITTAVFAFSLFLGFKNNRAYLFLMFFALSQLAEFTFNMISQSSGVPVFMFNYLREFYTTINLLHGLFLTLFLINIFELSHLKYWVYGCLSLHGITFLISETSNIYGNLIFAILIAGFALYQNKKGSLLGLIGLVSFLGLALFGHFRLVTYGFSFGVITLLFFLILIVSQKIAEQRDQLTLVQLKASQVESELMRRNIQPHFIMNTLLSIISWVKKEPEVAIKQIEALAEEFDHINQVSQSTLIPLHEEIEICENYLNLMGYRKNTVFNLITNNLDHQALVPPLLFHTLVENGITHSFPKKMNGTFELSLEKQEGYSIYVFSNDDYSPQKEVINEGFGYSYIRMKLDETFLGKWTLSYGHENGKWVTRIRIDK